MFKGAYTYGGSYSRRSSILALLLLICDFKMEQKTLLFDGPKSLNVVIKHIDCGEWWTI